MIQACLNGRRTRDEHAAIPITPDDLARAAAAAVAAGARSVHVHPRGEDGRETLDGEARAKTLWAMRAACPGIEISVTTGFWIEGDVERRMTKLETWRVFPDVASVNLAEAGAVDLCRWMLDHGIGVEAGVATVADTRALLASGVAHRCTRVLIEAEGDASAALAEIERIDTLLDEAKLTIPRLQHGYGAATWPILERAFQRGHDGRIGLEDTLMLADGATARDNAALVAACSTIRGRYSRR